MYVTTGQTLTMALRIFFCTLGRSRKLAKNWDREKLKLQSTPDNSNLQGKSKKERKGKKQFLLHSEYSNHI